MTDIYDEQSSSTQFEITLDDLDRVAERWEHVGTPQERKEIALWIMEGRIEHGADDPNEQAETILLNHGESILSRLEEALESDLRFTSFEDKWILTAKLPRFEPDALQSVYRRLLQNPSTPIDELLSVLKEEGSTDPTLLRMALHVALRGSPARFENMGTSNHPQWKALLPEAEDAQAIHYAYDPQTYEILCRPGQRLSQKKAARLQELNLYAHVVTFAE